MSCALQVRLFCLIITEFYFERFHGGWTRKWFSGGDTQHTLHFESARTTVVVELYLLDLNNWTDLYNGFSHLLMNYNNNIINIFPVIIHQFFVWTIGDCGQVIYIGEDPVERTVESRRINPIPPGMLLAAFWLHSSLNAFLKLLRRLMVELRKELTIRPLL